MAPLTPGFLYLIFPALEVSILLADLCLINQPIALRISPYPQAHSSILPQETWTYGLPHGEKGHMWLDKGLAMSLKCLFDMPKGIGSHVGPSL